MRYIVFILAVPGLIWSCLVITADLDRGEGIFLFTITVLLIVAAVLTNTYLSGSSRALYWITLGLTVGAALAASTILVPKASYATIEQPVALMGCWVSADKGTNKVLRVVCAVMAIVLTLHIAALVLAFWGMGGATRLLN